jgi:hypothetical protein
LCFFLLVLITIQQTKGRETYPEHPKLEDCEKLNTSIKNFCYDDVAEISGNEKICEKISDDDIKSIV